jgi:MATE family multidrug resistance protein
MLANLTIPLLGLVATAAVGRLGEAHLIGGVALAANVRCLEPAGETVQILE